MLSLTLQLPQTVLALAERRLQLLTEADRSVLTMAAVLGPEFSFALLEKVTQLDEDTLLDTIDRLLSARLVEELPVRAGEDYYRFVQEALRQALLSTISRRRIRRLHLRTGEAIEEIFDSREERVWPEMAYHFAEAGNVDKAVKYFIRTGDEAARVYANAEAAVYYGQALGLIETGAEAADTEQLIKLYSKQGRSLELDNQHTDAVQHYQQMRDDGLRRKDNQLQIAALIALAAIYATPTPVRNLEQAEKLADQALALARAEGDCEAEAKALWTLILVYKFTDRYQQAVDVGQQSIAIARAHNLTEQLAFSLNDVAWAYQALGHPTVTDRVLEEARELWRDLKNLPMLADNLASSASQQFLRGNFEMSEQLTDETIKLSRSINNDWNLTQGLMALGHLNMMRGDISLAIENLTKSYELSDQGGWALPRVTSRAELGWLYGFMGNIERGLALCEEAREKAVDVLDDMRAYPVSLMAKLYLMQGNLAAANHAIIDSRQVVDPQVFNLAAIWLGLAETDLYLARQEYEQAQATIDTLINRLVELAIGAFIDHALYQKSQVLVALGRTDQAKTQLQEAKQIAEPRLSRYTLMFINYLLGQLETDADRAAELRQQARILAHYIADHAPAELKQSFLQLPSVKPIIA
jgi:tetratricopeptide (TPR) repeat protein